MDIRNIILTTIAVFTLTLGHAQLQNWYHLDKSEGYQGVSSYKTYKELIKDNLGQTVIVAVIDSGVDAEHEDLKDNMWVNADEIPDNNIDDDNNGYIDDIHGWNFIGGKDGNNVGADSYEATRVYGKLKYKYDTADEAKLTKEQKKEYEIYRKVKEEVETNRKNAEVKLAKMDAFLSQVNSGLDNISQKMVASNVSSIDSLSKIDLSGDQNASMALKVINQLKASNTPVSDIESIRKFVSEALAEDRLPTEQKLNVSYNPEFDPRKTIVKDNYADSSEKYYGNNDVEGPDALHGTHVAGIIGAVSDNNLGNDGIARNVKLMSVRAVPDGDERDKDVANAIRYAVDNGATIINMSFGKGYSWDKKVVNEAVEYAAKNDVLLVHAAGNSGQDNDNTDNFPNDEIGKGGFLCKKPRTAKNWVEVGALSHKKDENMVATFSNYGQKNVDIFSPGVQIYNTLPNNEYSYLQGTSMASPVVAGVAAVLRSQFPTLTAEQVKDILLKSAIKSETLVKKPGSNGAETVSFKTLSSSGGLVNLYEAVKLAAKTKGKKKEAKKGSA